MFDLLIVIAIVSPKLNEHASHDAIVQDSMRIQSVIAGCPFYLRGLYTFM